MAQQLQGLVAQFKVDEGEAHIQGGVRELPGPHVKGKIKKQKDEIKGEKAFVAAEVGKEVTEITLKEEDAA